MPSLLLNTELGPNRTQKNRRTTPIIIQLPPTRDDVTVTSPGLMQARYGVFVTCATATECLLDVRTA